MYKTNVHSAPPRYWNAWSRRHVFGMLVAVFGLLATGCAPQYAHMSEQERSNAVKRYMAAYDAAQKREASSRQAQLASKRSKPQVLGSTAITGRHDPRMEKGAGVVREVDANPTPSDAQSEIEADRPALEEEIMAAADARICQDLTAAGTSYENLRRAESDPSFQAGGNALQCVDVLFRAYQDIGDCTAYASPRGRAEAEVYAAWVNDAAKEIQARSEAASGDLRPFDDLDPRRSAAGRYLGRQEGFWPGFP